MPTHRPLPPVLGAEFSVAAALENGVTARRLRGRDLDRPFRGTRTMPTAATGRAPSDDDDTWRRIRAYASIMPPHAFFVGPTAALIGGVPLPGGLHDDLHVGVEYPRTPPRRAGIRGRRIMARGHSTTFRGLRIASPALTAVTLAARLDGYDLVAAIDHLIRVPRSPGGLVLLDRTRPFTTRDEILTLLASGRWRCADRIRRAVERSRTGASSRPETWTRLQLVDAGLPEPVLDYDVFDATGRFIACGDMAYPAQRLLIEYEGDGHRDRAQFERDIDRYADLSEIGWRAVRLTSAHVFRNPAEGVRRVRAALYRSP